MPKSSAEVLQLAKQTGAKIVDLKFVDLPGVWQHFSIPVEDLKEDLFDEGIGFDGSSIRGFQMIHESDMLLVADAETACVDPALEISTLNLICNVVDPITRQRYTRDPRYIAQKAESYLKSAGIADISYWGPEAEFYIFDDVRYDQNAHSGYYYIDSEEGVWNTGRQESPNLGYKIRHKEGYFPVPPSDTLQDIRSEIILKLREVGVQAEVHHHEVGTAGQNEIDIRYSTLTKMADSIMYYKYVVRNIAKKHGKVATFMPKPIFGDNGSGMHTHQSLWKGDTNLFWDEKGYAQISQTARHYIGGLLRHAPALLGFCAPTTNSYRRLVPGFEAPVNLVLRLLNVFTNTAQQCILAVCPFHLRSNCPLRTQIASSCWKLAVIAAHPAESFSASTLSLAPPRELPITSWHATFLPLCQQSCCGGGDLIAAA